MIETIEFPNKGIVWVKDEAAGETVRVIVKNGMPGQKVRFQINKKRKNRCEGRLLEVLQKSEREVREPVCDEFPACGGCMYQTMAYKDQLAMKAGQVRALIEDALVRGGQVKADAPEVADYVFEGIQGSPLEFGYRNKMEFSFGDAVKDGPLTLGLHKKGSTYDVLTTGDCKIVHEDFTKILKCVLEYCCEQKLSYYRKMSHEGYLRHLLVRRAQTTGDILVNLVTSSQTEHDFTELVDQPFKTRTGRPYHGRSPYYQ